MTTTAIPEQPLASQRTGFATGLGLAFDESPHLQPSELKSKDNHSFPPPPYAPTTPSARNLKRRRSIDNLLYLKMLNLESMVSTIHESVVDQSSTYVDVASQLKEINDSMARFQQEASERLRKKLTGTSSRSSMYSECSFDSAITLESTEASAIKSDSLDSQMEEMAEEDTIRYQRVCSLVETLITDANSVLDSQPIPEEVALPSSEDDSTCSSPVLFSSPDTMEPLSMSDASTDIDASSQTSDTVEVKFYCQVTQEGTPVQRHELPQRLVLPLISHSQDVDHDRLALLPVTRHLRKSSHTIPMMEAQEILQGMLPDYENVAQKMVISLIYWTFLFAMGSLCFDSALCNMAGFQVMSILNNFNGTNPPPSTDHHSSSVFTPYPDPSVFTSAPSPPSRRNSL